MSYELIRLAAGSYDVVLNGVIVASLVRGFGDNPSWTAELLVDLPPAERPAPFLELAHEFARLGEACRWLGHPEIQEEYIAR